MAAREGRAAELVDPRPFAVGGICATFSQYPNVGARLPAMGYADSQVRDLEKTIARAVDGGVEAVAIGTPIDLARLIRIPVPATRVRYELQLPRGTLETLLAPVLRRALATPGARRKEAAHAAMARLGALNHH